VLIDSELGDSPESARRLYRKYKKLLRTYQELNQTDFPNEILQEQLRQDINQVIQNEKNRYEKVTTSHVEKSGQQVDLDFTHNRLN
jgi:hypothetical protein